MPILGLGLGLDYNQLRKSIIQELKEAGAVLALLSNKADGSAPLTGNNSPWVDLSGNNNDGTLTNFAGTGTSGWQASPPILRFDGVDDFVAFADTASLDITTAPYAHFFTFKKNDVAAGYVYQDNSLASESLRIEIDNLIRWRFTGNDITLPSPLVTSEFLNIGVFMKTDTTGDFYVDCVKVLSDIAVNNMAGWVRGIKALGGRTTGSGYVNIDVGTHTIYTGSDIQKILDVEAKISAPYLALNP